MLLAQRSLVRRITGVRLQVRMLHHTTKTSTATSQIDTTSAGDFKHSGSFIKSYESFNVD